MGTISVSLPSDGTIADVNDVNAPITTIVNEINGNLDNDNIKAAAGIAGSKLADQSVTASKLSLASSSNTQTVDAGQVTSSTTYVDLATVGPTVTVTIGASGVALITWGARVVSVSGQYSGVSLSASGANTIAGADTLNISVANGVDSYASRTHLATGLTAGSTTFTLKYRTTGGSPTFQYRTLSVIPL